MVAISKKTKLDEILGKNTSSPIKHFSKWIVIIAIAIIALILLVRFFSPNEKKIEYLTGIVQQGDIAITVTATGNLAPTNQVDVGSEISGNVEKVLVDVNAKVKKGQPIVVIDTSRLKDTVTKSLAALQANQASVAQARATLSESAAQLNRYREVSRLSGGRVPSETEIATQTATYQRSRAALYLAEANITSSQAQLSSDNTQLAKAVIRSPVTGTVLKRTIDPGQTVQSSFSTPSLFIIAEDLTKMKLEVSVDEADIGQVHEGQSASFTVDAYPGRIFPAIISRVNLGSKNLSGSSSNNNSSTSNVVSYIANLTLTNKDMILRPGMTATATIVTAGEKNVLMVPNTALRFYPPAQSVESEKKQLSIRPPDAKQPKIQAREIGVGSHQTVYILESNHSLKPVSVVTGQTDGRNTAVSSSELKAGMVVVTGQKAEKNDS